MREVGAGNVHARSPRKGSRFFSTRNGGMLLLLALIGSYVVVQAPWHVAPMFAFACLLLGSICAAFVFADRMTDVLGPKTIATLLYAASFSVGPLYLVSYGNYQNPYFGSVVNERLGEAAVLVLISFAALVVGYRLIIFAGPRPQPSHARPIEISRSQSRFAVRAGVFLLVLGVICYVVMIVKAGGISHILGYRGGRAQIIEGVYGGWFWGSLLIFAGYGLVSLDMMPNHPWLCIVVAAMISLAYFPLQGRDLIVAPFFCWLILFHYLNRPITWRVLITGGIALLAVSAFAAQYRESDAGQFQNDPGKFVREFVGNFESELRLAIALNIEELDAVLIAVTYVDKTGDHLGPRTLLAWAEPIDRQLFGDSIRTIAAGGFMDVLVMPDHLGWKTALSPSLVGELYISLGWLGTIAGMFAYGAVIGWLTRWRDSFSRSPILFAAYPFVTYMIIKMIVDGTGQLFRPVVVAVALIICASLGPKPALRRQYERV